MPVTDVSPVAEIQTAPPIEVEQVERGAQESPKGTVISTTADIRRMIPHREPLLFLDVVTQFDREGRSLTAILAVHRQFCSGHAVGGGGELIFPGIFMQEALHQAAGVLLYQLCPALHGRTGRVCRMGAMDLRGDPVVPGDELRFNVVMKNLRVSQTNTSFGFFHGQIQVPRQGGLEEVTTPYAFTIAILPKRIQNLVRKEETT